MTTGHDLDTAMTRLLAHARLEGVPASVKAHAEGCPGINPEGLLWAALDWSETDAAGDFHASLITAPASPRNANVTILDVEISVIAVEEDAFYA